jgi:DNA modification methylase
VLDPFNGSGTTGIVTERLGRRYIGLELSWDYLQISKRRLAPKPPKAQKRAIKDKLEYKDVPIDFMVGGE